MLMSLVGAIPFELMSAVTNSDEIPVKNIAIHMMYFLKDKLSITFLQ